MKIWILYICTGQYDIFRKDFYLSCEQFFLNDNEKHYFVFTDSKNIFDSKNNKNIHIFDQKNLWWPDNTLLRFHIFLSQKKELEKMDYLFFCNANLVIKKQIWNEILPTNEWIMVCQHPWFYNKKNTIFTYDRNKRWTSYIRKWDWKIYIAWGFNGGKSINFLNMCELLSENITKDKDNWIIAIWHDESHLNKYILDHTYKLLDPSYLYPEWWKLPFDCKILIRDKSKWIDIESIKWQNFFWWNIIKNFLYKIYIKIYQL